MPLTDEQKMGLVGEAVKEELKAVKPYLEKLADLRPEPGSLESKDYILAVGAMWYMLLGGLRTVHGERLALQEDIEANLVAALVAPTLVEFHEVLRRALDYGQMANPTTKA